MHHPELVEITVHAGVEISASMMDEWYVFLMTNSSLHCGVLVNHVNHYTYSSAAKEKVGTLPLVRAVAVLLRDQQGELAVNLLVQSAAHSALWNMHSFFSRAAALQWLENQR